MPSTRRRLAPSWVGGRSAASRKGSRPRSTGIWRTSAGGVLSAIAAMPENDWGQPEEGVEAFRCRQDGADRLPTGQTGTPEGQGRTHIDRAARRRSEAEMIVFPALAIAMTETGGDQ